MEKTLQILSIISLTLVSLVCVLAISHRGQVTLGSTSSARDGFDYASSSLVIASSTTATTTFPNMNGNRVYAYVKNTGGNAVTCVPGTAGTSTAPTITANKGWVIGTTAGTDVLKFDSSVAFTGQLWCLSNAATSSLSVIVK